MVRSNLLSFASSVFTIMVPFSSTVTLSRSDKAKELPLSVTRLSSRPASCSVVVKPRLNDELTLTPFPCTSRLPSSPRMRFPDTGAPVTASPDSVIAVLTSMRIRPSSCTFPNCGASFSAVSTRSNVRLPPFSTVMFQAAPPFPAFVFTWLSVKSAPFTTTSEPAPCAPDALSSVPEKLPPPTFNEPPLVFFNEP